MKILVCALFLTATSFAQEKRGFFEENVLGAGPTLTFTSPLDLSILRIASTAGNPVDISSIGNPVSFLSLKNAISLGPLKNEIPVSSQVPDLDLTYNLESPASLRSSLVTDLYGNSLLQPSIADNIVRSRTLDRPVWNARQLGYTTRTPSKPSPVPVLQRNIDSVNKNAPVPVPRALPVAKDRPHPVKESQPVPVKINNQKSIVKRLVVVPVNLLVEVEIPVPNKEEVPKPTGVDVRSLVPTSVPSGALVKEQGPVPSPVVKTDPAAVSQRVVREQAFVPQRYFLREHVPAGSAHWFKQQTYQHHSPYLFKF